MEQVHLMHNDDGLVTYDPFIANSYPEDYKGGILLTVRLDKRHIDDLSAFVWDVYKGIEKEYEETGFHYFEDNDDEPFPSSKETIASEPLLIDSYFRKSALWRDNLMEDFLFRSGSAGSKYFIIRYEDCEMNDKDLLISFIANHRK